MHSMCAMTSSYLTSLFLLCFIKKEEDEDGEEQEDADSTSSEGFGGG